jgi:hypothetical protein
MKRTATVHVWMPSHISRVALLLRTKVRLHVVRTDESRVALNVMPPCARSRQCRRTACTSRLSRRNQFRDKQGTVSWVREKVFSVRPSRWSAQASLHSVPNTVNVSLLPLPALHFLLLVLVRSRPAVGPILRFAAATCRLCALR